MGFLFGLVFFVKGGEGEDRGGSWEVIENGKEKG
jgi:hypothetical protein